MESGVVMVGSGMADMSSRRRVRRVVAFWSRRKKVAMVRAQELVRVPAWTRTWPSSERRVRVFSEGGRVSEERREWNMVGWETSSCHLGVFWVDWMEAIWWRMAVFALRNSFQPGTKMDEMGEGRELMNLRMSSMCCIHFLFLCLGLVMSILCFWVMVGGRHEHTRNGSR